MKLKDFFNVGPVFGYFFRKKDPNRPKNFDLKMMHGVNKLAVIMFAIAILILITRIILRNFFEY
jgi:hypothetical protein